EIIASGSTCEFVGISAVAPAVGFKWCMLICNLNPIFRSRCMFSRLALGPMMVCPVLLAFSTIASAQSKVAVINLQQAVFESAEIKKANDQMQATFKPRQDKIDQLQKEIAQLAQQLQASGGKLSPQAEQDLQVQGQKKQRDLQRLQDDLQADAQTYRNDIL